METILVLAYTEKGGALSSAVFETIGAALSVKDGLSAQLVVGLIGENAPEAANQLAGCGAAKFLAVTGPEFAASRYATDAAAAEAVCKASGASVVLVPGSSRSFRALPGVAQRLGGVADTHITGVSAAAGKLSASRWFYRQRMEGQFSRQQRPWVLIIDPGSQKAWQGAPGTAQVEQVPVTLGSQHSRTTFVGIKEPAADAQTIRPEAKVLFVTGAGWTKKQADGQPHVKEAEELILGFLTQVRASLGSSKSLVDLGGEGQAILSFLTHLNQIGQTGSTPRHQKGLATCCHGEEPHTVGWRFINERRAINLDPNCGWARGKADVLYVADAFTVMRKVNELMKA